MDSLTQCVLEAQKAGMSYGQYMSTRKPPKRKPKKPLPALEEKKPIVRVCAFCGKEFTIFSDYGNKYCGDVCRIQAYNKLALERYHAKRKAKLLGIEVD